MPWNAEAPQCPGRLNADAASPPAHTQEPAAAESPRAPGPGCAPYNPYTDLLSPGAWDAAAREFGKQACSLMGQVRACGSTGVCGGWVGWGGGAVARMFGKAGV